MSSSHHLDPGVAPESSPDGVSLFATPSITEQLAASNPSHRSAPPDVTTAAAAAPELDWSVVTEIEPHPAPPAPPRPPTPPTPSAPTSTPASQDDHVAGLAVEVVRLLDTYESLVGQGGGSAGEAAELLAEIERANAAPVVDEHEKSRRWDAVVNARAAYRRLLDGDVAPSVTVTPADLVDAEMLHRQFEQAEAKARKSMSGPGAFKKFAAARKALNDFLDRFGVDTYVELQQLAAGGATAGGPATLQEASDAVAVAEAQWLAVEESAPGDGLVASPEMDALRVRAYRLLGAVVDDGELIPRLKALAASAVDEGPILRQLSLAVRALGLPEDADPVASARAIRDELRR